MENIKFIIYLAYLFFTIAIVLFNWLYSVRVIRANKEIGLYTPTFIRDLIKISTGMAILTALVISIFMLV